VGFVLQLRMNFSIRYQPENITRLKNGVFVLKANTEFDDIYQTPKLGKLSLSYIHRIDQNWYVVVIISKI
jgi:hypothetical protein